MNAIAVITKTELRRLFTSPLAWSVLALVQFILAWVFLLGLNEYLTQIQPMLVGNPNAPGMTDIVVANLYLWAGVIMLAVMPVVTMRSFAEERMNQTMTLLTSAPISSFEIVIGKYLALLFLTGLMVLMISLMPLSLALGTTLDFGKIIAAMLGLWLLLASFSAAGMFLSSLTRQPIIAAVMSFGLLLFLVILYMSGSSQSSSSALFIYLSHFSHFLSFLEGLFDSSDLIYYLLFIATFVILTIRKLDNDRLQR